MFSHSGRHVSLRIGVGDGLNAQGFEVTIAQPSVVLKINRTCDSPYSLLYASVSSYQKRRHAEILSRGFVTGKAKVTTQHAISMTAEPTRA